jgi:7-carboxy-7-deazaguanine synthase
MPATYLVKEIFGPTIQGEGVHAGLPCVFLRFAACNLSCTWCDTDFRPKGAARMSEDEIAERLRAQDKYHARTVVVTGGEPTLQWDPPLAAALRASGFRVHMETNGTRPLKAPVDWLTVSPKPRFHGKHETLLGPEALPASECKVVVDDTVSEYTLAEYERYYACEHLLLQPCMDDRYQKHLGDAIDLVTRRPRWRLSLQLHKMVGLP